MEILSLLLILGCALILPGCGPQPKKIHFDPNTQIDCLLDEDEFVSPRERVHASDVARRFDDAQKQAGTLVDVSPATHIESEDLVRLFEAKLSDIPIPIGSRPIKQYFEAASFEAPSFVLGYVSEQTIQEIALFYEAHMEQFGWVQTATFGGVEQLLMFDKPDQLCVISLRLQEGWFYQNGYTQIIIFVTQTGQVGSQLSPLC